MRCSLRALWPLVLCVAGCYPEPTFDAEPCHFSTECERGKGCRVPDGQCINIPDDALMGSFTCTPTDDPTALGTFGGNDVTGYLDELEFSLIAATSCVLYPGGSLDFNLLGLRLQLSVVGIQSTDPGRHSFQVFDFANQGLGMLGPLGAGDTEPAAAFIASGFYELDREPRLDSKLGGYLEAFLDVPSEVERVGVPCEHGQPDCGAWPVSGSYCATFLHPVCTATCDVPSDCEPYGGDTCDDGFCYRTCSTNADCAAPLECLELSSGVNVCV